MLYSYIVALGSNLASGSGSPAETLRKALNFLSKNGAMIRATSRFYHTPAFPAGSGPNYVNGAVFLDASCDPEAMLAILHHVEAEMGRERGQRWGQRTLDLDLIACADLVLPNLETHQHWRDLPQERQVSEAPDQLILPHPRMQDRAFVLVPMADIAPDWVHPVLNRSVVEMLEALPKQDKDAVKRV
jgi:2-amino-4-hydroxy-6-hydroxymethyldihydropteridine diphosphokinase